VSDAPTPESRIETPETLELDITDVGFGGKGVARHEGCVAFVAGALTGERVRATVTRRHKRFIEAELDEILTASPERIAPACPLADVCPGCSYQHVTYETEVSLKQNQLQALLQRLGKVDPAVTEAPVPAPTALGYRNKITLHSQEQDGQVVLGYVGKDNETVIPVQNCPLAVERINTKLQTLVNTEGFMASVQPGMHVTLRYTEPDGILFWKGRRSRPDQRIFENTVLGKLRMPRDSFFQVNPAVADQVTKAVMEKLRMLDPRYVIDLYCGIGVFAIAAAQCGVKAVLGIDSDDPAIRAAHRNASKLGLEGIDFISARVEKVVTKAIKAVNATQTTVIIDPPRRGLDPQVVEALGEAKPANILYVSCAADTLSRDIARFAAHGYALKSARLFDMFPRTAVFETLAWLEHRVA
jgi:tRNA/tmRNA/rRNA uracil-C5-methylase (TrmA/RlmC/RlmD family)